jgi:hypothetical protein
MTTSDLSTRRGAAPKSGRESLLGGFVDRSATPLVTGLFAVSAVSGAALFFHWSQGVFHEMHEWLSMVLLVPFVLHVWKNWRGLLGYVRRKTLFVPLIASLAVALPFAFPGMAGSGGGNPAFRTVSLLTGARLADLAPVLKTSPDALLATLQQKGFPAQSVDQTLDAVAGKEAPEILLALTQPR